MQPVARLVQLDEAGMAEVFTKLRPLLDERQRRALAEVAARALGRGGVAQVAVASGMSRKTCPRRWPR